MQFLREQQLAYWSANKEVSLLKQYIEKGWGCKETCGGDKGR